MRIAIFEPEPRVCGPASWMYHLRHGFRALGHTCDVITFTKSGKTRTSWGENGIRYGIRWWSKEPDVVGKMADASAILDGYDAVILSDVRTVMHDKEALKGRGYLAKDLPDYITILSGTKTPFTFALHGNNYPLSEVPFAHQLVRLGNFTQTAVTHSATSPDLSRSVWPTTMFIVSPLPYLMQGSVNDDLPVTGHRQHVGITGRYISTKGHHVLGLVGGTGRLPHNTKVDLHGASSLSLASSGTYKTFEALRWTAGLEGQRFGVIKPGERIETGGDVIRPYPWLVQGPNGINIEYHGGYASGYDVCRTLDVHVDLTASQFSDGMEYSQFEAIDAGCLQVSVESMWSNDFKGETVPSVPRWFGESKMLKSDEGQALMATIGDAVTRAITKDDAVRRAEVLHNRETLATKHDPATIARTFITALT